MIFEKDLEEHFCCISNQQYSSAKHMFHNNGQNFFKFNTNISINL
jgi:hypothetical protein